jgi:hypothetical protein
MEELSPERLAVRFGDEGSTGDWRKDLRPELGKWRLQLF